MSKEIKVGMKCKQIKAIEKYQFDYVGEEFKITEVNDDVIMITNYLGKGGIDRKEFDTYFELVEDEKKNEEECEIKIGDTVKVIGGLFKDSNLEGEVNDILNIQMFRVIKIKLSDGNIITVSIDDIELIKPSKKSIHKEDFETEMDLIGTGYNKIHVKIRGLRTIVRLTDLKIKGSVYCSKNDEYDKQEGIRRAFKKAVAKQLLKEITE